MSKAWDDRMGKYCAHQVLVKYKIGVIIQKKRMKPIKRLACDHHGSVRGEYAYAICTQSNVRMDKPRPDE